MDTLEKIEQIEKKIEKGERKLIHNKTFISIMAIVATLAIAGTVLYVTNASHRISIDTSLISGSQIGLSPSVSGTLDQLYVKEGDVVQANTVVAKVGDELVKTKVGGIILMVQNNPGKTFSPGQPVVTMIDPSDLEVVGTIDENKGLDKIAVGQPVSFTVDAFGSKEYEGVIDQISSTSHQTGVVFNISDERPTQQFDIKARFNAQLYPELKNGMSAKMTIYIK